MKDCTGCGFINLPEAKTCLRCTEPFPVPPVDPSAPSPISTLLEQLADLGIDDLFGPGQVESIVSNIQQLLKKEESFLGPAATESPAEAERRKAINELKSLTDEAIESDDWSEDEWEDWLEEALDLEAQLDQPIAPVPLAPAFAKVLSKNRWMNEDSVGEDLSTPSTGIATDQG